MKRNPNHPMALAVEEIEPSIGFIVMEARSYSNLQEAVIADDILFTGVITKAPKYDGNDGWIGAEFELVTNEASDELEEKTLGDILPFRIYDNGVSCLPDGSWAERFTVKIS